MTAKLISHAPSSTTGLGSVRRSLLLSCAVGAALGLAGSGDEAVAQGFQGTPTVDSGQVTFDSGTPNTDVITVGTPTAVVNWDPFDASGSGPVNFLPNGNTAIFQNEPGLPTFVILNRILPTDPGRVVAFNGTVISQLQDAAGNVTGPGGGVAFYSPGGILIGSNAVFDVGSLLLTTLDPVRDGSGNFFGTGGEISLRLDAELGSASSAIQVQPGARIQALAEGSYIGMIAPG